MQDENLNTISRGECLVVDIIYIESHFCEWVCSCFLIIKVRSNSFDGITFSSFGLVPINKFGSFSENTPRVFLVQMWKKNHLKISYLNNYVWVFELKFILYWQKNKSNRCMIYDSSSCMYLDIRSKRQRSKDVDKFRWHLHY